MLEAKRLGATERGRRRLVQRTLLGGQIGFVCAAVAIADDETIDGFVVAQTTDAHTFRSQRGPGKTHSGQRDHERTAAQERVVG